MTLRTALVMVVLPGLFFSPALGSQAGGLAGEIITDTWNCADLNGLPPPGFGNFQWYEPFPPRSLGPSDTVSVTLALMPFPTGLTELYLNDGTGRSFLRLTFSGGLVGGLRYDRLHFNDVTLVLHLATQSFDLELNGTHAGPFPFAQYCADEGGCFSLQAFSLSGFSNPVGSVAWTDNLSIALQAAQGEEILARRTFDDCERRPSATGGAILFMTPPQRLGG